MTRVFDIIIIGGGIAGMSAAAELAQDHKVCVLERETAAGYHSTGRSAATFVPSYGPPAIQALARASEAFLTGADAEFWPAPLLSPRGEVMMIAPGEEDHIAEGKALGLRDMALDELYARVPLLRRGALVAALIDDAARDIDVDLLLQGYVRQLKARGGTVHYKAEVTGFTRHYGAWQVETAKGEQYSAAMVINAGGGWASATGAASLPDIVAAAKPSVLPVGTYNATHSPRFGFRGTGFVVADPRGEGSLIATNFHVLPDGADTESGPRMAVLPVRGGGEAQGRLARVVATDCVRDLALLRVEGPPLPAMTLAEAGTAREGQAIALMGFPIGGVLGYAVVTHRGIVASVTTGALPAPTAAQLDARTISRLRQGNFELLQLDATAYPGNSGGPVIDAESGRVLGVVSMVLVKGSRESALSSPTGITYAVPAAYLRELLAEV